MYMASEYIYDVTDMDGSSKTSKEIGPGAPPPVGKLLQAQQDNQVMSE
jgi:nucleoside-specific outer membrane channel protein Tsx